jgi:RNA polymerase sigma factor (sigma-70 family)
VLKIWPEEHSGPGTEANDQFKELFCMHYPELVRRLTFILGNRDDAEDIAQETFIKLSRSEGRINLVGPWLRKVGQRLAINLIRGEQNRKKREENYPAPQSEDSSENEVFRQLEAETVRQVLLGMSAKDRQCLVLKMSGFSYAEIAKIMDIREKSVGTVVSRAQQRFKDKYQFTQGRGLNCGVKKGDTPGQGKSAPELMKASCSHT